jgi:hypothetical protein
MKRKLLTVLYFVNGPIPSEAEAEDMERFGQGYVVRQRNAQMVHADECLEKFDIVAGNVPDNYAAKYAEQGEPKLPKGRQISSEGVAPGSPVAPSEGGKGGEGQSGDGKAAEGAETGAGAAAKPTPPTPKQGAGWKPNA